MSLTKQAVATAGSAFTLGALKIAPVKKSGLSKTDWMAIVPPWKKEKIQNVIICPQIQTKLLQILSREINQKHCPVCKILQP